MRSHLVLAVLAGSFASGAANATTYPAIYSLGDSLSDVGNALAASSVVGQPIPLPSFYFNGRFSNGPNWLDDLAGKLGLSASPGLSFPPGNDFAFGGAQTGETIANNPAAPINLPIKSRPLKLSIRRLRLALSILSTSAGMTFSMRLRAWRKGQSARAS